MEDIVISVEHLKKYFGSNHVIEDISFNISKGENMVVFGQSGSGKSVLIKCLVGLIDPDGGEVTLLGEKVLDIETDQLNLLRKKTGFLFQSAALYDSMTVRENIEFPLRGTKETAKDETDKLVREALRNVGLEDVIEKLPSELSGGMRKRVGLARALIMKPEIIFYDEPTTGLDPITSKEISQLILDVQKKYNATSIIITHDASCARITANKMIIIKEGKCVAQGTYKELSESADEWVRSFFE